MKIGNNNRIVDFQGKKAEVQDEVKSTNFETKKTEESADNVLGNYGKAFVRMSFKGNIHAQKPISSKIKELSDKEFKKYKKEFDEKLKTLPPEVQKTVKSWNIDKLNIFLADIMTSYSELYSNKDFMKNSESVLANVDVPQDALGRAYILYTIISDENLRGNKNVMKHAGDMIGNISCIDSIATVEIANKVLSDENLYDNKKVMEEIGRILFIINGTQGAIVADRILSNDKLYNNDDFMKQAVSIVNYADNQESAAKTLRIMDKFDNSGLVDTKKMVQCLAQMLLEEPDSAEKKTDKLIEIKNSGKLIESINKVEYQKQLVLSNPSKYIAVKYNYEDKSVKEGVTKSINEFFNENFCTLVIMSSIFDEDAMNSLFCKKFDTVRNYISHFEKLSDDDIELIKNLSSSLDIDGNEIEPYRKTTFINLIDGYNRMNMDKSKMYEMEKAGRVDITELETDLFKKMFPA